MRILLINPNSTAEMTHAIAAAAREAARPGTAIDACNPIDGPASIQGAEDGEAALPGLFALFEARSRAERYDAAVIACFDDTGLDTLKAAAPFPVLGIGEAGYLAALARGARFSVVTTLAVSIPVIEGNIARYGFASRCARVRASGVPVLDLEFAKDTAETQIAAEVERACAEDGVDAIVLGCAGMAGLAARMSAQFGLPVIDGVAAAIGLAETVRRFDPGQALAS